MFSWFEFVQSVNPKGQAFWFVTKYSFFGFIGHHYKIVMYSKHMESSIKRGICLTNIFPKRNPNQFKYKDFNHFKELNPEEFI